jgi:hypothetical protein
MLTLDGHDAERKQVRCEEEAKQAVEAWGREGERQGKQRAADARLVPRSTVAEAEAEGAAD